MAYFFASGVTARAAWELAEASGAELYEIKPKIPYTRADLDWMDRKSRSSFVGFPIWLAYCNLIHRIKAQ